MDRKFRDDWEEVKKEMKKWGWGFWIVVAIMSFLFFAGVGNI